MEVSMAEEDKFLGEPKKGIGNVDPNKDEKRTVSVTLTWNLDTEELHIDSEFENSGMVFKDPVSYTTELIQRGLEKWIREKVGMVCPSCSVEMDESWDFCPKCGYTLLEEGDENE